MNRSLVPLIAAGLFILAIGCTPSAPPVLKSAPADPSASKAQPSPPKAKPADPGTSKAEPSPPKAQPAVPAPPKGTPSGDSPPKAQPAVPSPPKANPAKSKPAASKAPPFAIPESPVAAIIEGNGYKIGSNGQPAPFELSDLPVAPGSVRAAWYQSNGAYVVLYVGLFLDETGPLCPGNSIRTATGFEHISNAPAGEGACEGATTLAGPEAGARICGPLVFYLTTIPAGLQGELFGTIERWEADGSFAGLTSTVTANPAEMPEIDLDASGYTVPAGFLPNSNATEVVC